MRYFLIMTLFCALSARAEIPLELVTEIQLPYVTDIWDVAHWDSDSTYGWAAASGSNYAFRLTSQDSTQFGVLTLDWDYSHDLRPYPCLSVNLAKVENDNGLQNPAIVIHTSGWSEYNTDREAYFEGYILPTNSSPIFVHEFYPYCGNVNQDPFIYEQISRNVWPPLPETSSYFIAEGSAAGGCNPMGSDCFVFEGYAEGWSFASHALIQCPYNTMKFQPFSNSQNLIAATYSVWRSYCEHDFDPDFYFFNSFSEVALETGTSHTPLDTICMTDGGSPGEVELCSYTTSFVTQCDLDGDRRIIVRDMNTADSTRCFDANTGEELWGNPDLIPDYSVRLPDRDDEVILQTESDHFLVYNAENGQLMDTTAHFIGTPKKVLKKIDGPSEFVTYDNGLLRIYKFAPYAAELTLKCENDMLQLNWNRFAIGATYNIYKSPSSETPFELMEYVATVDTNYFELTPDSDTEFYRVTAEY